MEIKTHLIGNLKIAEVFSDVILINDAGEGLELLVNMYYQDFDRILVHETNIIPAFFDLKTRMAGDMLQKFSNYRMGLTIVGDFEKYDSKSLHDFILESNKGQLINFSQSVDEALDRMSNM
ncbi:DUF4180 domain-containing protein [Flavobacterium sp. MAH-1]|uniref:DUF4180 domain-containing protein n=1 Tax=Flavobacterium agri TaxID=2743471 RepID=A0A7Y8Y3P2_9FLAO|nr:DUF4180 domain-containing protein [Flavobacterium agri]NUY80691.1 DUF4180 domain-containing protein [Flavobacterium agri]NYA70715.1 DUF4180 domain-containing protein [Flavobacterium agri]